MTNELSMSGLAAGLKNFRATAPLQESGVQYLKLSQDDPNFIYGKENTIVSPTSEFIVAASSLGHGWVAWKDGSRGEPIHETRCKITQPLPDVGTLPPPIGAKDEKYQFQVGLMLAGLTGKEKGVTFEWWAATRGMQDFVAKLVDAILEHIAKEGDSHPNPIVRLEVRSYKSKQGRRVNSPAFEIIGWSDNVKTADHAVKPAIAEPDEEEPEELEVSSAPRRRRAASID